MGMSVSPRREATGGGRRRRRAVGSSVMSDINVTPFVDVMLVLLIIFMVTAPLMATGIKVDLPEAASGAMQGKEEPVFITIDSGGQIHLDEQKVELDVLIVQLQAIRGVNQDTRLIIRGDRLSDYGDVMRVFGRLHEAGYSKVVLETVIPQ